MSIAETMLPEFDDEMARTRKVLALVPQEKMDWQAGPELRSIGWNANHLADMVTWSKGIIEESEFDFAPVDGPPHQTPAEGNPATVLANFDTAVAEARKLLADASDETLAENWELKMGGQTLQSLTKGACIRKWILNHTIHHRAILSVYLRMCGVEVTPVYNE